MTQLLRKTEYDRTLSERISPKVAEESMSSGP